ncbi:MAG: RluA family pseudouridine synthase [Cyclobacteriaceae bacterium]|nr:RluA family pseudouridine synthase [Cyclobacteriaceae bacterium]
MTHSIDIIYEDNHLLVFDKPAGILCQGDESGDDSLVELGKRYLKETYNKPGNVFLGLVHRLDRPVSGVVVMAKTSKALTRLNKQFSDREVTKIYWALTEERPPKDEDKLVHYLGKDSSKNKAHTSVKPKAGFKEAELSYKMIGYRSRLFLLEVSPKTGRPHQIRIQLAKIGCPIAGDVKYGWLGKNKEGKIALHAKSVKIIHPTKNEELTLTSKEPKEHFWQKYFS